MKTWFKISAAAAALCVAAAAQAQAQAPAQAPIKVGLMLPATGTFASLGNMIESGFKLYVKEQGGKLGGREIQYFKVDDESDPSKATDNVNKLIKRNKVDVLAEHRAQLVLELAAGLFHRRGDGAKRLQARHDHHLELRRRQRDLVCCGGA